MRFNLNDLRQNLYNRSQKEEREVEVVKGKKTVENSNGLSKKFDIKGLKKK